MKKRVRTKIRRQEQEGTHNGVQDCDKLLRTVKLMRKTMMVMITQSKKKQKRQAQ